MSTTFVKIAPTDPAWRPEETASAATVREAVARLGATVERIDGAGGIVFVDGAGFCSSALCPRCGVDLWVGDDRWWQEAMDVSFATGFTDRVVCPPCCGLPVDLDDLVYDGPQCFASWCLVITDLARPVTLEDEVALGVALGHAVRIVRSRI